MSIVVFPARPYIKRFIAGHTLSAGLAYSSEILQSGDHGVALSSESVGTLQPDGMYVHAPPDPAGKSHVDTSATDILTAYAAQQPAASTSVPLNALGVTDSPSVPVSSGPPGINYDMSADGCCRHRFACPLQGRHFGDRGSFIGFFDPLDGDEVRCVDNNVAPFGPMVVWRVMSSFTCDECCDVYAEVLDEGVTSVPVVFTKDPYVDLRRIVFERSIRRTIGRGGRRARSLSL